MPLVATRELVDRAVARHLAVAAFNIITLEHAEAVVEGAERVDTPGDPADQRERGALPPRQAAPVAAAAAAIAEDAGVPVALHLDHVEDDDLLRRAAGVGISSVMYDASKLDYAENVDATARPPRMGARERPLPGGRAR